MKKVDVEYVFHENPSLKEIGSFSQYFKYLKEISKESKVGDIVYHGTNDLDFEGDFSDESIFKNKNGVYFSKSDRVASTYSSDANRIFPALLNVNKPLKLDANFKEFNKLTKPVRHLGKDYFNIEKLSEDLKGKGDYDALVVENVKDDRLAFNSKTVSDTISVFNPNQIHILGSKKDKEGFKEFVSEHQGNALEKSVLTSIFAFFTIAGLLFSTNQLTGNVIGTSTSTLNFAWPGLALIGLVGLFISRRYKK